jgi:hypothetical protein
MKNIRSGSNIIFNHRVYWREKYSIHAFFQGRNYHAERFIPAVYIYNKTETIKNCLPYQPTSQIAAQSGLKIYLKVSTSAFRNTT